MPSKRIAVERTGELLDGLMEVFAAEGFASLKVSDLARRLKCSTSTLYRIAPSKESLVMVAITRWADRSLDAMKAEADKESTPVARARRYFSETVDGTRGLSAAFLNDVAHYESTRRLHGSMSNRFIDQFAVYIEEAVRAGEMRPVNARFLAVVFRRIGLMFGDPAVLNQVGLTHDEGIREVERLLWEGLLPRS